MRLDGDLATVCLRGVPHDREPEPGPAGLAAARAVDAVEALEDPLEQRRVDPARRNDPCSAGSSGLGLAIVRTIMTLHGGTAHAQSDSRGTRFILTFARA